MSQEKKPIRIAIGENLWTRALVDGSVRVDGFAVEFIRSDLAGPFARSARRKMGRIDGTLPITFWKKQRDRYCRIAIPVFMLGGFRQRTLLIRRGGLGVKDLQGRRVLMPRVLTPGAVYVRGLLADEFGIARESVEWHTIHGAEEDADWKWLKGRLNEPRVSRQSSPPRQCSAAASSMP